MNHAAGTEAGAAGVCLTFDVDAETGLAPAAFEAGLLSSLSERRYGVTRGLPRILDLLASRSIPATFYVPGLTAERHPEAVLSIAEAGHEIGHHGHQHLRPDECEPDALRRELEDGIAALERLLGVRPHGYRSPSWELTPLAIELLVEYGFTHDSSCMGDDRPYVETAGSAQILEIPVHWSLDDWPHFGIGAGTTATAVETWAGVWLSECRSANAEGRPATLTMHPEIIGRAYRCEALAGLLDAISQMPGAVFATHGTIARHA